MTLKIFIVRRRWLPLGLLAVFLTVGLPYGCSRLAYKERALLFNVQPGTASWFSGVPAGVRELRIPISDGLAGSDYLHAWWWPSSRANAPAILYLHGTRWNLTAQVGRITQLRDLGFSVLAIDYRGFGDSPGNLPSERSVYQDADKIVWAGMVDESQCTTLLQDLPPLDQRLLRGIVTGASLYADEYRRSLADQLPSGLVPTTQQVQAGLERMRKRDLIANPGHGQWTVEEPALESFLRGFYRATRS